MESFPQHARVVVIGGGVVGCSILYHLAKKGWRDILLLERRELSCGSSWHAAGQFHIINSNANLSSLQLHTLQFYPQLEKEAGQSIGLHRTGGIYLASTPERMNYLVQEQAKNREQNPGMVFISLEEACAKHPLINPAHFLGALYDPLDGHIDPAGVVQGYAKAAKKLGATIIQQTCVTDLCPRADGGWQVITEQGNISAEMVVNAGGLWARDVGKMAGVELPLQAMEHHYLITEALAEIENLADELPSFVDFDGNAYGRQEGQGLLLGTYEEGGTPWSVDKTPWDFGHELLPDDLPRIAPRLEMAFEHFPALASAGIKKVVNGPFTFAPDGNALIGPVPGLRNYWAACAVMAGFCQGAGIGKVFAEWMVEGEPGMDVFAMDVARFGGYATRHYTVGKVIENFGRRFQVSYPHEELPAMRPWRTTALYDRLTAAGAVWGASFGLEHALWFARSGEVAAETPTFRRSNAFPAVAEEVRAVRENVGLIEIANFAKYTVCGSGAASFLDTITAGALPSVGRLRLAPLLSPKGRLLGDWSVGRLGEEEFYIFGSGTAQMAHMRLLLSHLPSTNDVQVRNCSSELHGLAIAGPQSRALLSRVTRDDVSAAAFGFMSLRHLAVGGVSCLAARVSFTGELGYELYCAPEYQVALYEALTKAGADLGLRHFGGRALMSMRLEKNFGAWGLDFREDFTPAEAGLAQFVAADKAADFVGKAAFLSGGAPSRRRVNLAVAVDDADACGDEPIYKDGDYAGFITSGGYGHYVGQSFAMGYIDSSLADDEGEFAVEILGEMRSAKIQQQPAFDPSGARMRG